MKAIVVPPELLAERPRVAAVAYGDDGGVELLPLVVWDAVLHDPSGRQMPGVMLCVPLPSEGGAVAPVLALSATSAEMLTAEVLVALVRARAKVAAGIDPNPDPNPPVLDLSMFPVPPPVDPS